MASSKPHNLDDTHSQIPCDTTTNSMWKFYRYYCHSLERDQALPHEYHHLGYLWLNNPVYGFRMMQSI